MKPINKNYCKRFTLFNIPQLTSHSPTLLTSTICQSLVISQYSKRFVISQQYGVQLPGYLVLVFLEDIGKTIRVLCPDFVEINEQLYHGIAHDHDA